MGELEAGIGDGEAPIDRRPRLIAGRLPRGCLGLQRRRSGIRRLRHWRRSTDHSSSAMLSQLPCTGV